MKNSGRKTSDQETADSDFFILTRPEVTADYIVGFLFFNLTGAATVLLFANSWRWAAETLAVDPGQSAAGCWDSHGCAAVSGARSVSSDLIPFCLPTNQSLPTVMWLSHLSVNPSINWPSPYSVRQYKYYQFMLADLTFTRHAHPVTQLSSIFYWVTVKLKLSEIIDSRWSLKVSTVSFSRWQCQNSKQ